MKAIFIGGILNGQYRYIDEVLDELSFPRWRCSEYPSKGYQEKNEYIKTCEINVGLPIVYYRFYIKPVESIKSREAEVVIRNFSSSSYGRYEIQSSKP